jgi:hypothetical protein
MVKLPKSTINRIRKNKIALQRFNREKADRTQAAIRLPFCKEVETRHFDLGSVHGRYTSVFVVQGSDALFIRHDMAPDDIRKRSPIALRALFATGGANYGGPLFMDLIQLPDYIADLYFQQIADAHDDRKF